MCGGPGGDRVGSWHPSSFAPAEAGLGGDGRDVAELPDGRHPGPGEEQDLRLHQHLRARHRHGGVPDDPPLRPLRDERSDEHTSELQSLMRISYAVFCLKKNNHKLNMKNRTDTTKKRDKL